MPFSGERAIATKRSHLSGTFFESYASHFHDPKKAFKEITMRNSFYMAMTELRIARNDYLDLNYRKRLADEALQCLKWGLKIE